MLASFYISNFSLDLDLALPNYSTQEVCEVTGCYELQPSLDLVGLIV